MKNLYKIEDELYIISNNEAINENDHIITQDGRLVEVSYLLSKDVQGGHKVILTTNKLLIKDGVQAIDDEFLQWFVKNPSCEFVDIESYKIDKEWDEKHTQFNPIYPMKNKYKINIPQEEQQDKNKYSDEKEFYKYMAKQDSWKSVGLIIQEFIQLKLKEQNKELYSESDMNEFAMYILKHNVITPKEWFEKFKNK
jgi:hypothetical protein